MTTTSAVPPPAPAGRLRVGWALGTGLTRTARLPGDPRRRHRQLVRSAADLLCSLGVRVHVRAPAVAWPRPGTGRLVVTTDAGRLGALAVLTAVPGARVVDAGSDPVAARWLRGDGVLLDAGRPRTLPATVAEVTARLRAGATVVCSPEEAPGAGRFRPALLQAAVDAGAAVCPVAVAARTVAGRELTGPQLRGLRHPRAVVALGGVVVEVRLLPPLDPGTDRRSLAARVGEQVRAAGRATVGLPHPREVPCSAFSVCCSSSGSPSS